VRALLIHTTHLMERYNSHGLFLTPSALLTCLDPRVLQKFLPAVFAIRHGEQLVAGLGPALRRALLPYLLASMDMLVQAVELFYESYRQDFAWWQKRPQIGATTITTTL
jgi:hypothetical protein